MTLLVLLKPPLSVLKALPVRGPPSGSSLRGGKRRRGDEEAATGGRRPTGSV